MLLCKSTCFIKPCHQGFVKEMTKREVKYNFLTFYKIIGQFFNILTKRAIKIQASNTANLGNNKANY